MSKIVIQTNKCRLCDSNKLESFLNLGKIPVTNRLLKKVEKQRKIPILKIIVCKSCWHVQSGSVPVATEVYKNNYSYHTRFGEKIKKHFKKNAKQLIKKYKIKQNDLIIDIGGNDGTYLKNFIKHSKKIKTLCVEPMKQSSLFAKKLGIKVFNNFFNLKNSNIIKKKFGIPKIILCTNTFGNIDNLQDFTAGLENLMSDDTIFIFENPYLVNTIKNNQFDTMYYEHVSYFSISPMINFFKKFNLEIFDYKKTNVHGGSIMIYVRKKIKEKNYKKIKKITIAEKKFGLANINTYRSFANRVFYLKQKINKILIILKKKNKKIIAYGASDRGTVLMNYCGLNNSNIDYIVDKNPYKQGLFTPGNCLKIFNLRKLKLDKPDYIFLNSWTFKEEIFKELKKFNFKYIIPFPNPRILRN